MGPRAKLKWETRFTVPVHLLAEQDIRTLAGKIKAEVKASGGGWRLRVLSVDPTAMNRRVNMFTVGLARRCKKLGKEMPRLELAERSVRE